MKEQDFRFHPKEGDGLVVSQVTLGTIKDKSR